MEREHLTENQIAGYRARKFDMRESREIGRHLLKCESCRRSLPAPTFDDFWNAVMSERKTENIPSHKKRTFSLAPFVQPIYTVSFAALLLFLGAGFAYFIFFNKANTDLNSQIITDGQPVETAKLENKPEVRISESSSANIRQPTVTNDKKRQAQAVTRKMVLPETKIRKDAAPTIPQNSNRGAEIATVRGNTNPLKENELGAVKADLSISGDRLKLTWSNYPQAVEYSVVISDAENNEMIDEIKLKSETKTSIPLKKFEPLKKYEIKIAAIFQDGMLKTSRTFTFKRKFRKH